MIVVDGSCAEGGGSILRLSLAFSIYTKKPFKIINIRKGRKKPGLNSQNLASIFLAQKVCNAKVVGARRGSFELEFYPGDIVSKSVDVDIGSAGSVILALQSVFLPCVLSGKTFNFTISGGTDVAWSPGFDYFNEVFLPLFEDYAQFDFRLFRRGFYPKGGGKVSFKIKSFKESILKPVNLVSLGRLVSIKGISLASKDLESVNFSDVEADNLVALLSDFDVPISLRRNYYDADSTGSGVLLYGVFEFEDSLFKSGVYKISPVLKKSVSEEVVEEFRHLVENDVPVDEFFADQLIPFLGVFGGCLKTVPVDRHLSDHLLANVYVVKLFLGKEIVVKPSGFILCK